ncbi:MAG: hypothetical protein HYZ53_23600 [Planctomycetes bacterium]|nr:hypothetical protein [Planctomycetota bacterium]
MRKPLVLVAGLLLFTAAALALAAPAPAVPDLAGLVRAYLAGNDPGARRETLDLLRARAVPHAELRAAVEAAFTWGPAPTGTFYQELDWRGEKKVPCHLFVPKAYDPGRAWPLVIGLHGIWGHGDQIVNALREEAERRGYLLACPTTKVPWWSVGPDSEVFTVVRSVCRQYRIDTDRVHLLGVSMGGFGAWMNGLRRPDRWATILSAAGGFSYPEYLGLEDRKSRALLVNAQHLGCWLAHGSGDVVIPARVSRRTDAQLRALGYDAAYLEQKDAEHRVPDAATFDGVKRSAFEWMEGRRRDPLPREVSYVSVDNRGRRAYWVELGSSSGTAGVNAVAGPDNRLTVSTVGSVRRITLYLTAGLADLDRAVRVEVNGRVAHEGLVARDARVLLESARVWHDPRSLYDAALTLEVR